MTDNSKLRIEQLRQQARRVRNYSDTRDVFWAVPLSAFADESRHMAPAEADVGRVARIIEESLVRHGVDLAACEGTLDDASAVLAALRATPAVQPNYQAPADLQRNDQFVEAVDGLDPTKLRRVHDLRMKAHWGKNCDTSKDAWPKSDADWRQTPHGAPWDTNVHMAKWHLAFAKKLQDEGLLT